MKMTKKWLMIAAALLLVGLTLVLSVLAFYWGDWTAFNTVEPMEPVQSEHRRRRGDKAAGGIG